MINESLMVNLGQDNGDILTFVIYAVVIVAGFLGNLMKKKGVKDDATENLEELAEQRKRQLAHLAKKRSEELKGMSQAAVQDQAPQAEVQAPRELSDDELRRRAAVIREQRKREEAVAHSQRQATALQQREQRQDAVHMEEHRWARLKDLQGVGQREVEGGAVEVGAGHGGDDEIGLAFDMASMRRGIVMQELLMPPIALREDSRY